MISGCLYGTSDLLNSLVSIKPVHPHKTSAECTDQVMGGTTEILLVHPTAAIFTQLGTRVSSCAASLHAHMPQNKTTAWNISPVESQNVKKTTKCRQY